MVVYMWQTCFRRICVFVVACVLVVSMVNAQSVEEPVTLKPGDQGADWSGLKSTDDKVISLSELSNFDVVIMCFTCNTCPYSVDYEDRLKALQEKIESEKLSAVLVAINSNAVRGDALEAMKRRAEEKGFRFAYVKDESQVVARAYGAIYTPEFYVLDKRRRIVYRGAMDDQTDAALVTKNYVELAVAAAMKGDFPADREIPARGCTIRYQRRRRP